MYVGILMKKFLHACLIIHEMVCREGAKLKDESKTRAVFAPILLPPE